MPAKHAKNKESSARRKVFSFRCFVFNPPVFDFQSDRSFFFIAARKEACQGEDGWHKKSRSRILLLRARSASCSEKHGRLYDLMHSQFLLWKQTSNRTCTYNRHFGMKGKEKFSHHVALHSQSTGDKKHVVNRL